MGCDIIVIDVHAGFQEKLFFWRMGCDIFIVDEWNYCVYLTCVVWRHGECESQAWKKYVYAECDLLLMLLLMIMLIWNEVVVVVGNVIEMRWCYVENGIGMECWWCWKCIEMCMIDLLACID